MVGSVFQRGAPVKMTGVAFDAAATDPSTFVAVCTRTSSPPASAAVGTYVEPVAPVTGEQFTPFASQRSH